MYFFLFINVYCFDLLFCENCNKIYWVDVLHYFLFNYNTPFQRKSCELKLTGMESTKVNKFLFGKTWQLKLTCYWQLCTTIIINLHAKTVAWQVELHLGDGNVRCRVFWNNVLNRVVCKLYGVKLNTDYTLNNVATQYNLLLHLEIGRTNPAYFVISIFTN